MKKWSLFLSLYLCLCLLAACAAAPLDGPDPGGTGGESDEAAFGGEKELCRVVAEENGTLTLAEMDGGGVYTLSLEGLALTLDGAAWDPASPGAAQALPGGSLAGALAEVCFNGMIQESWPAGFGGATGVRFSTEGFDDRCGLYLDVLEDLWDKDAGLNSDGPACIGVDLSGTGLTESEQSAVAWLFACRHDGQAVEGTWEELAEQGYLTGEPLEGGGTFWQWEDGVLFSITEKGPGRFDAQKWRSALGAYFFSDCTASQSADGHWNGYTIGSEAIS